MRSARNLLILGAFTIALIMSVGYATLSQDISNITKGSASNVQVNKYDVEIVNAEVTDVYGTASGNMPIYSKEEVNFNSELIQPGDMVIYTLTIKNMGQVSAVLSDLNILEDDGGSEAAFYSLTGPSETLAPGEETTMQVVAAYNNSYVGNLTSNIKSATSVVKYEPAN